MLDALTLDQLRAFIAVAEEGSFSAAGRRLGRVQSAVSQSVQTLESVLGTKLFDRQGRTPKLTEAGRVMLRDSRHLIAGADTLRARADSIASDVEPELSLAVDAMFPNKILMASLKALSETFPCLPVSLFTEGLGAPEQRLRDGVARLAIYCLFTTGAQDLESEYLTSIPLVPVVAAHHPLAAVEGQVTRDDLEPEVQLVLTDRTSLSSAMRGGIISHRLWRFADLHTRMEYLLAGFGWCNMPAHLVEEHIAGGRLKRLHLKEQDGASFPVHVVHVRGTTPGRAGRWLVADLRKRLPANRPVQ